MLIPLGDNLNGQIKVVKVSQILTYQVITLCSVNMFNKVPPQHTGKNNCLRWDKDLKVLELWEFLLILSGIRNGIWIILLLFGSFQVFEPYFKSLSYNLSYFKWINPCSICDCFLKSSTFSAMYLRQCGIFLQQYNTSL